MFEFDAGKFLIIGIVALLVIGPKELPRVMRTLGHAVGKMRKLAGEFQSQFMEAMREADVADLKTEAKKLADQAKIDVDFNPVSAVKSEFGKALNEHQVSAAMSSTGAQATSSSEPSEPTPETTPMTIYNGAASHADEPAPTPEATVEAAPVEPVTAMPIDVAPREPEPLRNRA
jgi:sec-independent protein translocase protein TatB